MNLKEFLEPLRGRGLLEHEAKGLLKTMGLSVPRGTFIGKGKKMPALELTYPLVAKVSAKDLVSKSDIRGIRLGIKTESELQDALKELSSIEGIEGVLIEEMAPPAFEVIVGATVDRQFGPVLMLGLGGLFVELFKDVAFALVPLDRALKKEEALWLVNQLKGRRLFEGYRGSPPLDTDALYSVMAVVAEIISTGTVSEINLNPVALYPKGAIVLDAKINLL